ncbi:uncharacterized protein LOC110189339 [Drosophila serrata]|uniref:uncharacterized protein LOC110189339 n=1 Tax=Drosophila serrata TaxID=7274 RepID=UPI000A1D0D7A|nr:uncharacterized protein LOC110189339 [Drosophila serrata]
MALTTEATWTERKGTFYNINDRIMDRMLRTLDESWSPCKHFYRYSNGRHTEGFDVNPGMLFADSLEEQINAKLHDVFEKFKNRSHKEGSMEEKVFRLYNSCEAARRENRSSNIFLDVMRPDVNLSWPLYMPEGREWPKDQFRWLDTLARMSRYGLRNFLFHVSLRVDSEDNRSYITRMSLQKLEAEYGINLMKFFKIALDRKLDPNTEILVDVGYLTELNQMLNSYDQETVAHYLMERFGTFMTSYEKKDNYQCIVAVRTSMKAACEKLYKKHILGETQELEAQVQRVFEAIKKQFSRRLTANRLNLSTTYISNLRKKLETTTINIGVLPKKKNRQKTDNYLYDKLKFNFDDDFATMQLNALDVLAKSEDLFQDKFDTLIGSIIIYPGFTIEFGSNRTIFIPYDLLEEPIFMTQSHDVFKVSLLGYIIAEQLLKALYPMYIDFDCKHYKEFIDLLDNNQLYWDRSSACSSRHQVDEQNWWGLHLVVLNIVHDAYFSPDSGFSQEQPDFTSKPLKQLFFLNVAQYITAYNFFWTESTSAPTIPDSPSEKDLFYNTVFRMPSYAEAFNCSTSDYIVDVEL